MRPWSKLWGVSALSQRINDEEDTREHALPLLPNQEPSGEVPNKVDIEFDGHSSQSGSPGSSSLFYDFLAEIIRIYGHYKISLIAITVASAVGLIFIKLVYGRTNIVGSAQSNDNVVDLTPTYFKDLGARRVRIRYGPYTVPPSSVDNGMADFVNRNSTKPCEDCLITFVQAGLEYPDGSYANADTGLWLHHVVQMDTSVDDTVCGKSITNRKLAPNRFFASGNERSPLDLCAKGTQRTGYFLSKSSTFVTAVELMNETPNNLTGIVTIDYEFLPANPFPSSFQKLTSVWLDAGGCGSSDIPVRPTTTFTLNMSTPWVVPEGLFAHDAGRIALIGGHLHDGGTHVELLRNNIPICDSVATYGATPGYVDVNSGMQHISNMTICDSNSRGVSLDDDYTVRAGEEFSLLAHYDTQAHSGMSEPDGSLAPVMGLAILYFASIDV